MISREQMLEFGQSKLISVFLDVFANEYGEKKVYEIEERIYNSEKLKNLLLLSINNNELQSSKVIINYLLTIPFFSFAKAEKLCLGAMIFTDICKVKLLAKNNKSDNEFLFKMEDDEKMLFVDIILESYEMRYMEKNSLFEKYFQKLIEEYYAS